MGEPRIKASHRENAKQLQKYANDLMRALWTGPIGWSTSHGRELIRFAREACMKSRVHAPAKLFDSVLRLKGWDKYDPELVMIAACVLGDKTLWQEYSPDPGPQRGKTKPRPR